ncbi:MAG TPA: glycoside hydrolase, partial [Bacteroidales bacterium]|nr:glycoside hydrolase [Bacteroidales bacterium]
MNTCLRSTKAYVALGVLILASLLLVQCDKKENDNANLFINDSLYFEAQGMNILVFGNYYNGLFSDEKMSGIQIIHHGIRTATNGDVRLNPTPEQWDPFPQFIKRKVFKATNTIEAYLAYPKYGFNYMIKTESRDGGLYISVNLQKPLPTELEGIAGFNFEFLPSAYFGKTFLMDDNSGLFPLYPSSSMETTKAGIAEPKPIAKGATLVLAPEDPLKRITIKNNSGDLSLYDGRNKAQNGWYVVRSMIPANKTGKVIEWFVKANTIPDWIREPVITYSQLGYHPNQQKVAVIELDKHDKALSKASLIKIDANGNTTEIFSGKLNPWGTYLRYNYVTFDFSAIKEP